MLENKLLVLRFEILIFQDIPNYLKHFVHLLVDIAKASPSSSVSVNSVFAVSGHNTMLYLLGKGNKKINFNKKKFFQHCAEIGSKLTKVSKLKLSVRRK